MNKSRFPKLLIALVAIGFALPAFAQDCYWVFLTDKQGSTFDPYTYFDAKAIERYRLNNADLNDISNHPLSSSYVSQINTIASEEVGQVRWFNAMAVMATPDQIQRIQQFPFVSHTRLIASDMQIAQARLNPRSDSYSLPTDIKAHAPGSILTDQLLRMQGQLFHQNNINGKGVRVAVLDNGFPSVNTNVIFKHLRDNNQILATWNFPERKENVYGPGGHGTMVLSCIAGIYDSLKLGLATGAQFLLARTEIASEPFKEEVWWMMAVEWADKNGADIINSSLGYGKDRHFTYEMDGRSFVAKAANMAARKGILVCNSAGNEGDDKSWKTIITPADADSVITVGGIKASLSSYQHIDFSSYGPTADGRLKPNVCNYGYAMVAKPRTSDEYDYAYGTSFSSPLTAGFCACAKQAAPQLSAMQLKEAVEHSADLYPYFDYAFGYGVPQASYFVNGLTKAPADTSFRFVEYGDYITIVPTGRYSTNTPTSIGNQKEPKAYTLFFKKVDNKGVIQEYANIEYPEFGPNRMLAFPKSGLYNATLVVSLGGFSDSYRLSDAENKALLLNGEISDFEWVSADTAGNVLYDFVQGIDRTPADLKINEFNDRWNLGLSFRFGTALSTSDQQLAKMPFNFGLAANITRQMRRWYSLGASLSYDMVSFSYDKGEDSPVDDHLGIRNGSTLEERKLLGVNYQIELFQRIRLVPGGAFHNGLYWDLGVYGGWCPISYYTISNLSSGNYGSTTTYYNDIKAYHTPWNWGVSTRLCYDWIGLYAKYHLGGISDKSSAIQLPRLRFGLTLNLN